MDQVNEVNQKDISPEEAQEQMIRQVLKEKPEMEPIMEAGLPELSEPIETFPEVQDMQYFEELCRWLSNGYTQLFQQTYTEVDYQARHVVFPPEQFPTDQEINKQTWSPIAESELRLEAEPARDRYFTKSYPHHVFLISILEAIGRDTEEFIRIYAKRTNKGLELKEPGGFQRCMRLLISELKMYLQQEEKQLIPALYSTSDNGRFMSVEAPELEYTDDETKEDDEDNRDDAEAIYEFGFSKISSDSFSSRLIVCIEMKLSALEDKPFIIPVRPDVKEELTLTEKALIVAYLQDEGKFIVSNEQVRVIELVSFLFSANQESVKKAFQKVHPIRRGHLSSHEAKPKLKNLQRILPVFERLELKESISRIEKRIKEIEVLINRG